MKPRAEEILRRLAAKAYAVGNPHGFGEQAIEALRADCIEIREPVTPWMRRYVFERDEGRCQICDDHVDSFNFHVDHIVPVWRGGRSVLSNLRLAHPACNVCRELYPEAAERLRRGAWERWERREAARLRWESLPSEGFPL